MYQSDQALPYTVRPARETDITQLSEIEKEAFPTLWPSTPFRRDLTNGIVSYLVACQTPKGSQPRSSNLSARFETNGKGDSGALGGVLRWLFRRKAGEHAPDGSSDQIVGYVSTWFMTDEAHITGIAVRESLRGHGLGELLLLSAIETAMNRHSRVVTLEVRVSNQAAQSLYAKYGFNQVGLRKGYYADNHEDAYIMTTEPIASPTYGEKFRTLVAEYTARRGAFALNLA